MLSSILLTTFILAQASELNTEEIVRELGIEYSHLKDPFSAQYRNISVCGEGDNAVYMGRVNAKSQSGGYGGWNLFVFSATGEKTFVGADMEEKVPAFAFLSHTYAIQDFLQACDQQSDPGAWVGQYRLDGNGTVGKCAVTVHSDGRLVMSNKGFWTCGGSDYKKRFGESIHFGFVYADGTIRAGDADIGSLVKGDKEGYAGLKISLWSDMLDTGIIRDE